MAACIQLFMSSGEWGDQIRIVKVSGMGIPGLTWKLQSYLATRDRSYFEGGDFHVDGCNFLHMNKQTYAHTGTRGFIQALNQHVEWLRMLKPRSLTFYFDAAIPLSKIPTRLGRHRRLIFSTNFDAGILLSDLGIEELVPKLPHIDMIMTGCETEDFIMYTLAKNSPLERKNFVFSSDSDCFTFTLPDPENVDIVPIKDCEQWSMLNKSYKMSEVTRSGHLTPYMHEPQPPEAETFVNPTNVSRRGMEFLNTLKTTGECNMFLPVLPFIVYDPYLIGQTYRRAAYKAMALRCGVKDERTVAEYRQQGNLCLSVEIQTADQQELEEAENQLEEPIVQLLMRDIKDFSKLDSSVTKRRRYGLSDLPPDVYPRIERYLEQIVLSDDLAVAGAIKDPLPTEKAFADKLCVYLLALVVSIDTLSFALLRENVTHMLKWKLHPRDIYFSVFCPSD